jgi:hypothetical protein
MFAVFIVGITAWLGLYARSGLAITLAVILLVTWVVAWPQSALLASAHGKWTSPRFWLILPLYFPRRTIVWVRTIDRETQRDIRVGFLAWLTYAVVQLALVATLGDIGTYLVAIIVGLILIGLLFIVVRNAWLRRVDSRAVSVMGRPEFGQRPVGNLQELLNGLKTDGGVQLVLRGVRKQELQRNPEVADFLDFLSWRLEEPTRRSNGAGPPGDWLGWWSRYQQHRRRPLSKPSSETVDELGRILEDARRASAFNS